MTTTITSSAGPVIVPDLVFGYESTTDSQNIIHRILGRTDPDVSLEGDGRRAGRIELFFLTRAAAWAAHAAFRTAATFGLVDTDLPEASMTFVREGSMAIRLDSQTLTRWILEVGFQEVAT